MRGFCYFLPGRAARAQDAVRKTVPALDGDAGEISVRGVMGGPFGQGVLAWAGKAEGNNWSMQPDRQRWAKAGEYFVGMMLDARPGPQDLARPRQTPGLDLAIGGKAWHVPQLRGLPRTFVLDGDGQIVKRVASPAFRDLWERADLFFRVLLGQDDGKVGDQWLFETAVLALGLNYRIGPVEAAMLELIDTSAMVEVLKIVIDWSAIEEACKKKQQASESSGETSPSSTG